MDAKMVSMEYTSAEKKEEAMEMTGKPESPQYPWGLAIRLEKEELDKLGIKELPQVGDECHLMAVGMVTSVTQDIRTGQDEERCVGIQIVGLQVVWEDKHPGEESETMADENSEQNTGKSRGGMTVLGGGYRSYSKG